MLAGVTGVGTLEPVLGSRTFLSMVFSSSERGLVVVAGVSIEESHGGVSSQPRLSAITNPWSGDKWELSNMGESQAEEFIILSSVGESMGLEALSGVLRISMGGDLTGEMVGEFLSGELEISRDS